MHPLLSNLNIQVTKGLYLKDPESSDLGKRIIEGSIELIDEIGFEQFTFKKLATEIGSTEASIYRYFESKHKILLYLSNWYWLWTEYRMAFHLANIGSPQVRLERAINLLTDQVKIDQDYEHINETKLHQIVISESMKAYLHREVDEENRTGAFIPYKRLVNSLAEIILEINPVYKYPHMLISTLIEGAHLQTYFALHLPRLTDIVEGENAVRECYKELIINTIKNERG